MYNYNLSHLITFARIAAAMVFLLPFFLLVSKCSSSLASLAPTDLVAANTNYEGYDDAEYSVAAAKDKIGKYDFDKIVFAARDAEVAGGLVYIHHEDGTSYPIWESLADLQRKLGLYYVNAYTIVNLEKGCYRRLDGEHVWSTTLGDVRITSHFFNRNNRNQFPSCP